MAELKLVVGRVFVVAVFGPRGMAWVERWHRGDEEHDRGRQHGGVRVGAGLLGADPELGSLADNGGPTRTYALPPPGWLSTMAVVVSRSISEGSSAAASGR